MREIHVCNFIELPFKSNYISHIWIEIKQHNILKMLICMNRENTISTIVIKLHSVK